MRDLDGNDLVKVWFSAEPVTRLQIQSQAQVSSNLHNPFEYLLEPWAIELPIDYPLSLWQRLQPYLGGYFGGGIDPIAAQLGAQMWAEYSATTEFLGALNQRIYDSCAYSVRLDGLPRPPGVTWTKQAGSCRDLTVLFMEVCRSVGLAARFVSGYEAGATTGDRYLHAWAEIYLPGAGWRGYDPTHGLLAAANHVVLATAPHQQQTMPVEGRVWERGIAGQMSQQLLIQKS